MRRSQQTIIFKFPEIVGDLRLASDNLPLIELVIVNNRISKAWLPALPAEPIWRPACTVVEKFYEPLPGTVRVKTSIIVSTVF